MFFSPKTFYPIGLDISDLTIKFVQLVKVRDKIKISSFGHIDLPAGIIDNGEIKNEELLKKELGKLLSNPEFGKVENDEVIACLPESQTFIKLIEVEKKKNTEETIKGEVEKEIPFSINDLCYDYQLMESKTNSDSFLIGAAPKAVVDKYTFLLDQLKFSVIALEIEPVSICRAMLAEEGLNAKAEVKNNYCLIDIGAQHASLTVYAKNAILFSLSIPFSGNEITEIIAKKIKITREQAEKAKIVCGLDKDRAEGAVKNILTDQLSRFVGRIKEGINYFATHYPDSGPLNKIMLCGGGAYIKALPGLLKNELGIETVLGNPFVNINYDKTSPEKIFYKKNNDKGLKKGSKNLPLAGQELTFATAMGLALRDIFIIDL